MPHQVATALALVDFPIHSPLTTGTRGWKDPELIGFLAEHGYVWITKDDEARRKHLSMLLSHQIGVVWVRGFERHKKPMSIRDFHRLLTITLPRIEAELIVTPGPKWYEIFYNGDRPTHAPLDAHGMMKKRRRQQR